MQELYTEKLYYEDKNMTSFSAMVVDCTYDAVFDRCLVILNRTAFFPEAGGQKADKGTLNGVPVLDVTIKQEVITHILEGNCLGSLPVGTSIEGCIDWSQRFDFMQQHTGEHIISGLVNKHFGWNNVGFHLGYEEVTLDFDGLLSLAQLRDIEVLANQAIWKDLPVHERFPTKDELSSMNYRSKLELEEDVRIVEIPGYDVCACCAPHVETTGQIGLLKVTGVQSHRGGIRVNILCGVRALHDYTEKQDSVTDISVLLSAKPDAVSSAVERLLEESQTRKGRIDILQEELLKAHMDALPAPSGLTPVLLFEAELDTIAMRNTVNALMKDYHGYCSVFSGNDIAGYRFITGSSTLDCRMLSTALKERFQAKSGGSPQMIQGNIAAARKDIHAFYLSANLLDCS